MKASAAFLCVTVLVSGVAPARAQIHPDQHYVLRIDSLSQAVEAIDGIELSADGAHYCLKADRLTGYVTFVPQTSAHPFNQGLPSWNGSSSDPGSAFRIEMRFPAGSGWSPWLTVGYWRNYVWGNYGTTSYPGGYVDVDYVKLNSYVSRWQFRILMSRAEISRPSPSMKKLSFFVSDSRTTSSQDFTGILADCPGQILVPTDFIYQYGVDPDIGGSICSPTSVSMILKSYGIPVNPPQFANDTYDPEWEMFGVWPRVVQNAAEYGLDGAVTRFRSWSQARDVLAGGGRISMSVGLPLYEGHLMMLAGFTPAGDPIVHDPARSNGYSYVYRKADISHSWFDKGGIGYTFYPAGTGPTSAEDRPGNGAIAEGFRLDQNYPNPFNPSTTIGFDVPVRSAVALTIHNSLGEEVRELVRGEFDGGHHRVVFDATGLASGVYFCRLKSAGAIQIRRMVFIR
jgi:hypothetical protein